MDALKRKVGPFSAWVWLLLLAAVVLAWWYYRKHATSGGGTPAETVLTTGVLPQDAAAAGAPASNSAPADSLSPDVLSQLSDLTSTQNDFNTSLSAQLATLDADVNALASTTLSAPTVGGVNQAWTPAHLHLPKSSSAKPTTHLTKTKPRVTSKPKPKPKPKPKVKQH